MKGIHSHLLSGLVLLMVLMVCSCGSDDSELCGDGVQNADETGIDCGGPVCGACPTCDDGIQNGDEEAEDCGGSFCEVCPTCTDGVQNGTETGIDCGGTCSPCLFGAQGVWYASGTDLSLILAGIEDVDNALVDFQLSNNYTMVYNFEDGTQSIMLGTYQQTESSVADIWTLSMEQTSPDTLSFSGIVQLAETDTLLYELIELDGDNEAPTPSAGFGSSNGGDLGNSNIIRWIRI